MGIVEIKKPVWDSKNREWILEYVVNDKDIGLYTQVVKCEALISAERIINILKQKGR